MANDVDNLGVDTEVYTILLKKLLGEVTVTSEAVLIEALKKILTDERVKPYLKDGRVVKYVYVIGYLSYEGRDVNRDNIEKIFKTVGIETDPAILDALLAASPKSHLMYLHAVYLLVMLGKEITLERVLSLVEILGSTPDPDAAREVMNTFKGRYNKA